MFKIEFVLCLIWQLLPYGLYSWKETAGTRNQLDSLMFLLLLSIIVFLPLFLDLIQKTLSSYIRIIFGLLLIYPAWLFIKIDYSTFFLPESSYDLYGLIGISLFCMCVPALCLTYVINGLKRSEA